jgi:hypothetical protein
MLTGDGVEQAHASRRERRCDIRPCASYYGSTSPKGNSGLWVTIPVVAAACRERRWPHQGARGEGTAGWTALTQRGLRRFLITGTEGEQCQHNVDTGR